MGHVGPVGIETISAGCGLVEVPFLCGSVRSFFWLSFVIGVSAKQVDDHCHC
jgi:hypothetical protein